MPRASQSRPKPRSSARSNRLGADRRKLNQDLIDTAGRIRGVEAQAAATEARLKPLDENERNIRKSLDGRRAVIGEVLAALQRIGHRPPPALIASPEDALQSVRTAMLLGAVLPEMRHEVEALANDLTALLNVRKQIAAERDRLKNEVASLGNERTRMTALVERAPKAAGRARESARCRAGTRRRTGASGRQSQRFDREAGAGARSRDPGRPRGGPRRYAAGDVGAARSGTASAGGCLCVPARTSSNSG